MAVCAAAVGDPLVETLANRGLLGGRYADNDHASVLPALLAGIAIALFVGARLAFLHRRTYVSLQSNLRDVTLIAALQFPALFIMESAEDGRLADGLSWLGGPAPVSLALHLLVGLAAAAIAARVVNALARTIDAIAGAALTFGAVIERARASTFRSRRDGGSRARALLIAPLALRGRAPPFPALL